MLKRNIIILPVFALCLLLVQCTSITIVQDETPPEEKVQPIRIIKGPYLQNVQRTAITIMWETDLESTSQIDYGNEIAYSEKVVCEKLKKIHEITISRLEEETIYHYQVSSRIPDEKEEKMEPVITSKDSIFKTAVREDSPFTFAVYGDNRTYPEVHEKIAKGIAEKKPDIVLNTGDVVEFGLFYEGWGREFFEPAQELFRNTPFYIAIGNHEQDAPWYYDFVSFPEPENYYSFDYGNAHFTIIDSNQWLDKPDTEQYEWLEEDLKSTSATWKFVFFHHPPYSSYPGYTEEGTEDKKLRVLCPLFERYNVDVVFSGHVHNYERTYPLLNNNVERYRYRDKAVVYIVTGGGGAEHDSLIENRSYFTAESAVMYHYCISKIDAKNFQMMVYDIEGKPFDFLNIRK